MRFKNGADVIKLLNDEVSRIAAILSIQANAIPNRITQQHELSMVDVDCVLVKGDNLNTLARLAVSMPNSVDFCYIDPPYNTDQSFAYSDSRLAGESHLWGPHAEWMAFMLPRFVVLRRVLKEHGILAVSIDDYEYSRLKTILDVVFGEKNHIATLIVTRSKNGKGSKAGVSVNHEYVLLYGRSKAAKLLGLPEQQIDKYDKHDAHGWYKVDGLFRKKGDASRRIDRPNMFYPLYYDALGNVFTENSHGHLKEALPIDSAGVERRWLWGRDKAKAEAWKLYASKNGVVYVKNYLTDEKRIKVRSTWDDLRYLTERATNEVKEIYGEKIFETPKPVALLEDLIECCADKDALILDFFAGTGTTAHAARLVDQKDGGTRKVILAEIDTPMPEGHLAVTYGFSSVASLTEARLGYIERTIPPYKYAVYDEPH